LTLLLGSLMRRSALLGAVLALIVGFATFTYVRSSSAITTPAPAVERAAVLVARREILPHTVVTAADVELRDLPAEAVLLPTLRSTDAVIGLVTTQHIVAGQQLLPGQFVAEAAGGTLAQLIPEGSRAVAIAISDAIAAGGLIAPGDRVDVVAVFDESRAGRSGSALVVDDVGVLAVASLVVGESPPESEARSRSSAGTSPRQLSATVTLAVSPAQAQRLAVAEEFGELRLVLRRAGDSTRTTTATVDLERVTGASR